MNDDPIEDQRRQVKQAIEAMSRGPTEEQAQQGIGEQVQQAIKEAHERHLIGHEEAVQVFRDHLNCPEGHAVQKLREAETSGTVRFYRPGPPDYNEDEKAAIYNETDLRYWLTRIAAPERIKPVTAEPAQLQQKVPKPAKRRGRKDGYDWPDAIQFMHKLWAERGDPGDPLNRVDGWRSDSDIGVEVQAYILKHEGKEPDHSAVMKHLRPELEKLRAQ